MKLKKANIRTCFSIIPQTHLGFESLIVRLLYALLIYCNHKQAGAKLHKHSCFWHTFHLTIDLINSSESFIIFSEKKSGYSPWKSAQFEFVHNSTHHHNLVYINKCPKRCNNMQPIFYCNITLHVSGT